MCLFKGEVKLLWRVKLYRVPFYSTDFVVLWNETCLFLFPCHKMKLLGLNIVFCVRKPHEIAGNILDLIFHLIETSYRQITWYIFFVTQQPIVGQGLRIIEASQSHSDKSHSAGLLRTSDQPDVGTSTWQGITLTTDRHPFSHTSVMGAVANSRLRRHGH